MNRSKRRAAGYECDQGHPLHQLKFSVGLVAMVVRFQNHAGNTWRRLQSKTSVTAHETATWKEENMRSNVGHFSFARTTFEISWCPPLLQIPSALDDRKGFGLDLLVLMALL